MNLKKLFIILPLVGASFSVSAEGLSEIKQATTFQFTTEVSRTVQKDLMEVSLYSRKLGNSLNSLKNEVSANLNKVLDVAKQYPDIEVQADGILNRVNYNDKGKVDGWVAEGYINLKSKNFAFIEKVLENLGNNVAINNIGFSVSPETMKALEDEMTLAVIKQFQHKAEVVQKGLNAKSYQLVDVQLNTPNGVGNRDDIRSMMAMAKSASYATEEMPLEAGKETISATASGRVEFK